MSKVARHLERWRKARQNHETVVADLKAEIRDLKERLAKAQGDSARQEGNKMPEQTDLPGFGGSEVE